MTALEYAVQHEVAQHAAISGHALAALQVGWTILYLSQTTQL